MVFLSVSGRKRLNWANLSCTEHALCGGRGGEGGREGKGGEGGAGGRASGVHRRQGGRGRRDETRRHRGKGSSLVDCGDVPPVNSSAPVKIRREYFRPIFRKKKYHFPTFLLQKWYSPHLQEPPLRVQQSTSGHIHHCTPLCPHCPLNHCPLSEPLPTRPPISS
jgi:hypothetical protein